MAPGRGHLPAKRLRILTAIRPGRAAGTHPAAVTWLLSGSRTAATAKHRANIRTVRAAASDRTGTLTLYLEDPANLGHTTAIRPRHVHATFHVPVAPLTELLGQAGLDTVRVIKIDVEGAEAAAVRGLLPALPHLREGVELVVELAHVIHAEQGFDQAGQFVLFVFMGWSSTSMAQRYQHVTEPMLNDVGRKIGAALWGDVGSGPEDPGEDAA